jgi:hypothetical protein
MKTEQQKYFTKKHLTLIFLTLFFALSAGLQAHTVYLKNGQRITGKITSQTSDSLEISVNGKIMTILKSNISQIDYFDTEVKKEKEKAAKPAKRKEKKDTDVSKEWGLNRWTVTGRSVLIPGWGHYAVQEYYYAGGHAFLNLAALGYAYSSRDHALAAKAVYEKNVIMNMVIAQQVSGGNITQSLVMNFFLGATNFNTYNASVVQYNNSISLLALVYLAQVGHAYYSGYRYEKEHPTEKAPAKKETSGSFGIYVGPDTVYYNDKTQYNNRSQYASVTYTLNF